MQQPLLVHVLSCNKLVGEFLDPKTGIVRTSGKLTRFAELNEFKSGRFTLLQNMVALGSSKTWSAGLINSFFHGGDLIKLCRKGLHHQFHTRCEIIFDFNSALFVLTLIVLLVLLTWLKYQSSQFSDIRSNQIKL